MFSGEIPQGMMYNVRTAMKERGFEEPGFDPERQNFALIIDAALQLVKKVRFISWSAADANICVLILL